LRCPSNYTTSHGGAYQANLIIDGISEALFAQALLINRLAGLPYPLWNALLTGNGRPSDGEAGRY
jgi:hypothetical protein